MLNTKNLKQESMKTEKGDKNMCKNKKEITNLQKKVKNVRGLDLVQALKE